MLQMFYDTIHMYNYIYKHLPPHILQYFYDGDNIPYKIEHHHVPSWKRHFSPYSKQS